VERDGCCAAAQCHGPAGGFGPPPQTERIRPGPQGPPAQVAAAGGSEEEPAASPAPVGLSRTAAGFVPFVEVELSTETQESLARSHHWIETMLERAGADPEDLGAWEEVAGRYERTTCEGLLPVGQDQLESAIAGVQRLMVPGMSSRYHRRACHLLARLAGISAMTLFLTGDYRESDGWFGAGQRLAEQAGDQTLQASLLALSAADPILQGQPGLALARARAAQTSGGHSAAFIALGGPYQEIWALTWMGRAREAEEALRRLDTAYQHWSAPWKPTLEDCIHEWHLHWAEAQVYSALGMAQAGQRFDDALATCPQSIPAATIRLDRAAALARQGEVVEACRRAGHVLTQMPPRGPQQTYLGRFLTRVPSRYRDLRCVQDLKEEVAVSRDPGSRLEGAERGAVPRPGSRGCGGGAG
jgi:hypothetical protein